MPRPAREAPLLNLRTYGESHAVRLPDYDYTGDADVHLTLCADRGRPFNNTLVADMVCASVERSSGICGYRLFGFCLMPDHVHVLLSPGWDSECPLEDWLQRFKSFTTNEFTKLGGQAPLWQRSAYDHVCRKQETAERVLTYIVNNPVRSGLVECWMDWPWTRVLVEL